MSWLQVHCIPLYSLSNHKKIVVVITLTDDELLEKRHLQMNENDENVPQREQSLNLNFYEEICLSSTTDVSLNG